ncbi:hypothetical protein FA421_35465, partial [Pseudomonas aeruginosa]|nr:hypothetical protein [Pseudomonas aeruginosa]
MSMEMIDIAKRLLASSIDGKTFSEEFFKTWRSERDSGVLAQDDASLGRCLSLMFGPVSYTHLRAHETSAH